MIAWHRWGSALVLPLVGLVATPVSAFTVRSAFTDGCHELVTGAGFFQALPELPPINDDAIPSDNWEEVLDHLYPDLDLPRGQKFVFFSLIAGVRGPDSEGYSLTNLSALRGIQGDPAGQYVHCLRAESDDFVAGNGTALEGCRQSIIDSLRKAVEAAGAGETEDGVITVPFALDNYGSFDLRVSAVAYYVGRALHTFQDSFTHTLRSPDMRRVVHMMNYEAAIVNELEEHRDGMAHSSATDSCNSLAAQTGELVNRDRVFAATEATADLLRAFARVVEFAQTDPDDPMRQLAEVDAVLLKWMRLADPADLGDYTECTMMNDYCDSPWLSLARVGPAGPTLSCAAAEPGASRASGSRVPLGVASVAVLSWAYRRRRYWGRS
ncbi:MAG: hypothetical protein AAGF12_04130 [Myxococcota bacterium]